MSRIYRDKYGNRLCVHRRRKSECKDCVGCVHGRLSRQCKDCKGQQICEHSRFRSKCVECSPEKYFKTYMQGAKKRSLEFSITLEEYLKMINLPCFYCGERKSNGIDRKNNLVGYTTKNCVSCCSKCNIMKRNHSVEEFLNHVRKIVKFKTRKILK